MSRQLVDISGIPLPPDRTASSSLDRILSVPPVRDVPNEQAIEFTMTGFAQLAAGGATFITLTDPQTGQPFSTAVPALYRGVFNSMLIYCPDMVAAPAPYLFAQLTIAGQLANAWGFVPVYPRNGVASLAFDMKTDLAPNAKIGLAAENTDPVNAHFIGIYLYGWFWPNDLSQG